MESKSNLVLIIIVAVLSVSLAVLAAYLLLAQGNSDSGKVEAASVSDKHIPKNEDLVSIPLFSDSTYFALKKTSSDQTPILQAKVTLKCYKTLKRDKKAVVEEIVATRSEEIQELVVRFFMTLTSDDVKDVAVLDRAKEDLKNQINDLLNEGEEEPEDIVYNVIFSEWLFM